MATAGNQQNANDSKEHKKWEWWTKKIFLFGICFCASPFILLAWNIANFAYVGLVQQMVPQIIAPSPPPVPLAPSPQPSSKGEPSSAESSAKDKHKDEESLPLLKWFKNDTWHGILLTWLVVAVLIFFLIVQPLVAYAKQWFTPLALTPPNATDNSPDAKVLISLIEKYRARALFARVASLFMVVFIVGLLLVGLLIFVSADRLASTEETLRMETSVIVSTLATRIGAVLILFFLVRNLNVLYRYSVRLVGFYDSRADALQLVGKKSPAELKEFIDLLFPSITFDDIPKTPVEELSGVVAPSLEVAKKVAGLHAPAEEPQNKS